MISRFAFACAALAIATAAAPLMGQEEDFGPPPALVDQLTAVARSNLTKARLPDGSQVPAETPEELAQPIVPRSLEVQTIERGLLSATMDTCALDSDALSYLPYMRQVRASARYSDKQLAYVGLLHGVTMGFAESALDDAMCGPEFNASLREAARETPIATP